MRNGRSRHTRQPGDRRRRPSAPQQGHPFHPNSSPPNPSPDPRNPHLNHPQSARPREVDPREFESRPYPPPKLNPNRPIRNHNSSDRRVIDRHPIDRPPHNPNNRPSHNQSSHNRPTHNRATATRPQPPAGPRPNNHPQSSTHPSQQSGSARQRPRQRRKSRSSKSKNSRQHNSWQAIAFQGFILSVALGLFCGLIARRWGTALSNLPDASTTPPVSSLAPSTFIAPSDPSTLPGAPIDELNQALEDLDAEYPNLQLGTVLVDISQRNYAGLRAQEAFPAASTIKLAVLAAVLESVDSNTLTLTEKLTLHPAAIAEGSGTLRSEAAGTEVSVLKAAEMMISTSDNTATNLLIERLGGTEALNRRFLQWNLQHTTLVNPLPDRAGENTSSPADFALLLGEIERGEILEMSSRDRFLDILSSTRNDSLLPQSLEEGDRIAHKTGTIDSVLGDVGLIDLPNGERYIAAVMVRRTNNDSEAQDVIREVSRLARTYWGQAPQ